MTTREHPGAHGLRSKFVDSVAWALGRLRLEVYENVIIVEDQGFWEITQVEDHWLAESSMKATTHRQTP